MSCNLDCNNVATLAEFEKTYNTQFAATLGKINSINKVNNSTCDILHEYQLKDPNAKFRNGNDAKRVNFTADANCNWTATKIESGSTDNTVDPTYLTMYNEKYDNSNRSITNQFRNIPDQLLLNNNIFLNTYDKSKRVYINKFNNVIRLTLRATAVNISFTIFNNTNGVLIANTVLSNTNSQVFVINNYDESFITIRRTDTIANQSLLLEKITFNNIDLELKNQIRADLVYNATTDPERFNRVLSGTFSWSTNYRISLFPSYIKNIYVENINHLNNTYGLEPHTLTITSLINIPLNAEYLFRAQYNGSYRIQINNWKTVILTGNGDKTSIPEILLPGLYIIYIEKECKSDSSNFTLSYSTNNGTTWLSIDTLLLNGDASTFNSNDKMIFYNSILNYCSTGTNGGIKQCSDFFNNTMENNLYQLYLNMINSSLYPKPINGKVTDTWYVKFGNNQVATDDLNNREKINYCGKDITATRNIIPARYGGDNPLIESRKLNIDCWTDSELLSYYCPDSTKCELDIPTLQLLNKYESVKYSQYQPNADILTCSKKQILANRNNISTCYKDWNTEVSTLLLVSGDEALVTDKNIIYSNVRYCNNYTWNSLNGSFKLCMQTDGNLVLSRITTSSTIQLWDTKTSGNPNAILCMQRDGNLVIYSSDGSKALWASGTNSNRNSYCILHDSSLLT